MYVCMYVCITLAELQRFLCTKNIKMKFSKKFKFNKQIYPLAWQPRRQCCTLAKNSEERSGKRKGGKRNLEKGDEEEGKNGETRMRRV
jgi:hypothetical protein